MSHTTITHLHLKTYSTKNPGRLQVKRVAEQGAIQAVNRVEHAQQLEFHQLLLMQFQNSTSSVLSGAVVPFSLMTVSGAQMRGHRSAMLHTGCTCYSTTSNT